MRRKNNFIRFNIFIAILLFLSTSLFPQYNTMWIPDTLSGTNFNLTMQISSKSFLDGLTTETYGFNGNYLGPTIIWEKGDWVQMNVTNQIGETSTVHWHGAHVPPEADGGHHSAIQPGETWTPYFQILDQATTMWYHPHLHERTEEHVYRGLAGAIIIRDEEEAALSLPREYGVDDIPLIIQDRSFNADGSFVFDNQAPGPGEMGELVVVNGTLDALQEVPAQHVRFRLINGSSARVYNIGLSDDRNFQQIASDGGLLESPVTMNRLRVGNGERMEIVVDFSANQGDTLFLMSYASELTNGEPGGVGGMGPAGPLDGADFNMVALVVTAPTSGAVSSIPANLTQHFIWDENDADTTRVMVLNGPPNFAINGAAFDPMVVNETVRLGNIEIWEIQNPAAGPGAAPHPFHIHDVQFYILDRGGVAPPENERGRKDVVLVYPNEPVRFITKFEDFADEEVPYMYHCHFLRHEDRGMMGQFIVTDTVVTSIEDGDDLQIPAQTELIHNYPNPFNPQTTIVYEIGNAGAVQLVVYNILGQPIAELVNENLLPGRYEAVWNASGFASGVYIVRLFAGDQQRYRKMILMQ